MDSAPGASRRSKRDCRSRRHKSNACQTSTCHSDVSKRTFSPLDQLLAILLVISVCMLGLVIYKPQIETPISNETFSLCVLGLLSYILGLYVNGFLFVCAFMVCTMLKRTIQILSRFVCFMYNIRLPTPHARLRWLDALHVTLLLHNMRHAPPKPTKKRVSSSAFAKPTLSFNDSVVSTPCTDEPALLDTSSTSFNVVPDLFLSSSSYTPYIPLPTSVASVSWRPELPCPTGLSGTSSSILHETEPLTFGSPAPGMCFPTQRRVIPYRCNKQKQAIYKSTTSKAIAYHFSGVRGVRDIPIPKRMRPQRLIHTVIETVVCPMIDLTTSACITIALSFNCFGVRSPAPYQPDTHEDLTGPTGNCLRLVYNALLRVSFVGRFLPFDVYSDGVRSDTVFNVDGVSNYRLALTKKIITGLFRLVTVSKPHPDAKGYIHVIDNDHVEILSLCDTYRKRVGGNLHLCFNATSVPTHFPSYGVVYALIPNLYPTPITETTQPTYLHNTFFHKDDVTECEKLYGSDYVTVPLSLSVLCLTFTAGFMLAKRLVMPASFCSHQALSALCLRLRIPLPRCSENPLVLTHFKNGYFRSFGVGLSIVTKATGFGLACCFSTTSRPHITFYDVSNPGVYCSVPADCYSIIHFAVTNGETNIPNKYLSTAFYGKLCSVCALETCVCVKCPLCDKNYPSTSSCTCAPCVGCGTHIPANGVCWSCDVKCLICTGRATDVNTLCSNCTPKVTVSKSITIASDCLNVRHQSVRGASSYKKYQCGSPIKPTQHVETYTLLLNVLDCVGSTCFVLANLLRDMNLYVPVSFYAPSGYFMNMFAAVRPPAMRTKGTEPSLFTGVKHHYSFKRHTLDTLPKDCFGFITERVSKCYGVFYDTTTSSPITTEGGECSFKQHDPNHECFVHHCTAFSSIDGVISRSDTLDNMPQSEFYVFYNTNGTYFKCNVDRLAVHTSPNTSLLEAVMGCVSNYNILTPSSTPNVVITAASVSFSCLVNGIWTDVNIPNNRNAPVGAYDFNYSTLQCTDGTLTLPRAPSVQSPHVHYSNETHFTDCAVDSEHFCALSPQLANQAFHMAEQFVTEQPSIIDVAGDGNCLFHAILNAFGISGVASAHFRAYLVSRTIHTNSISNYQFNTCYVPIGDNVELLSCVTQGLRELGIGLIVHSTPMVVVVDSGFPIIIHHFGSHFQAMTNRCIPTALQERVQTAINTGRILCESVHTAQAAFGLTTTAIPPPPPAPLTVDYDLTAFLQANLFDDSEDLSAWVDEEDDFVCPSGPPSRMSCIQECSVEVSLTASAVSTSSSSASHSGAASPLGVALPDTEAVLVAAADVLAKHVSLTHAELLNHQVDFTLDVTTCNLRLDCSSDFCTVYHSARPFGKWLDTMFSNQYQVISSKPIFSTTYWECVLNGTALVAVTLGTIPRNDQFSAFGCSSLSWSCFYADGHYSFTHNAISTILPSVRYERIGVFIDGSLSTISFYGIANTPVLLHVYECVFTDALYAGFGLDDSHDTASFCQSSLTSKCVEVVDIKTALTAKTCVNAANSRGFYQGCGGIAKKLCEHYFLLYDDGSSEFPEGTVKVLVPTYSVDEGRVLHIRGPTPDETYDLDRFSYLCASFSGTTCYVPLISAGIFRNASVSASIVAAFIKHSKFTKYYLAPNSVSDIVIVAQTSALLGFDFVYTPSAYKPINTPVEVPAAITTASNVSVEPSSLVVTSTSEVSDSVCVEPPKLLVSSPISIASAVDVVSSISTTDVTVSDTIISSVIITETISSSIGSVTSTVILSDTLSSVSEGVLSLEEDIFFDTPTFDDSSDVTANDDVPSAPKKSTLNHTFSFLRRDSVDSSSSSDSDDDEVTVPIPSNKPDFSDFKDRTDGLNYVRIRDSYIYSDTKFSYSSDGSDCIKASVNGVLGFYDSSIDFSWCQLYFVWWLVTYVYFRLSYAAFLLHMHAGIFKPHDFNGVMLVKGFVPKASAYLVIDANHMCIYDSSIQSYVGYWSDITSNPELVLNAPLDNSRVAYSIVPYENRLWRYFFGFILIVIIFGIIHKFATVLSAESALMQSFYDAAYYIAPHKTQRSFCDAFTHTSTVYVWFIPFTFTAFDQCVKAVNQYVADHPGFVYTEDMFAAIKIDTISSPTQQFDYVIAISYFILCFVLLLHTYYKCFRTITFVVCFSSCCELLCMWFNATFASFFYTPSLTVFSHPALTVQVVLLCLLMSWYIGLYKTCNCTRGVCLHCIQPKAVRIQYDSAIGKIDRLIATGPKLCPTHKYFCDHDQGKFSAKAAAIMSRDFSCMAVAGPNEWLSVHYDGAVLPAHKIVTGLVTSSINSSNLLSMSDSNLKECAIPSALTCTPEQYGAAIEVCYAIIDKFSCSTHLYVTEGEISIGVRRREPRSSKVPLDLPDSNTPPPTPRQQLASVPVSMDFCEMVYGPVAGGPTTSTFLPSYFTFLSKDYPLLLNKAVFRTFDATAKYFVVADVWSLFSQSDQQKVAKFFTSKQCKLRIVQLDVNQMNVHGIKPKRFNLWQCILCLLLLLQSANANTLSYFWYDLSTNRVANTPTCGFVPEFAAKFYPVDIPKGSWNDCPILVPIMPNSFAERPGITPIINGLYAYRPPVGGVVSTVPFIFAITSTYHSFMSTIMALTGDTLYETSQIMTNGTFFGLTSVFTEVVGYGVVDVRNLMSGNYTVLLNSQRLAWTKPIIHWSLPVVYTYPFGTRCNTTHCAIKPAETCVSWFFSTFDGYCTDSLSTFWHSCVSTLLGAAYTQGSFVFVTYCFLFFAVCICIIFVLDTIRSRFGPNQTAVTHVFLSVVSFFILYGIVLCGYTSFSVINHFLQLFLMLTFPPLGPGTSSIWFISRIVTFASWFFSFMSLNYMFYVISLFEVLLIFWRYRTPVLPKVKELKIDGHYNPDISVVATHPQYLTTAIVTDICACTGYTLSKMALCASRCHGTLSAYIADPSNVAAWEAYLLAYFCQQCIFASQGTDCTYTPPSVNAVANPVFAAVNRSRSALQSALRKFATPSGDIEKHICMVSTAETMLTGLIYERTLYCPRHIVGSHMASDQTTADDYYRGRLNTSVTVTVAGLQYVATNARIVGTLYVADVECIIVSNATINFASVTPGDVFSVLITMNGAMKGIQSMCMASDYTISGSFGSGTCGSVGYTRLANAFTVVYFHQIQLQTGVHTGCDGLGHMYGNYSDTDGKLQYPTGNSVKVSTINVLAITALYVKACFVTEPATATFEQLIDYITKFSNRYQPITDEHKAQITTLCAHLDVSVNAVLGAFVKGTAQAYYNTASKRRGLVHGMLSYPAGEYTPSEVLAYSASSNYLSALQSTKTKIVGFTLPILVFMISSCCTFASTLLPYPYVSTFCIAFCGAIFVYRRCYTILDSIKISVTCVFFMYLTCILCQTLFLFMQVYGLTDFRFLSPITILFLVFAVLVFLHFTIEYRYAFIGAILFPCLLQVCLPQVFLMNYFAVPAMLLLSASPIALSLIHIYNGVHTNDTRVVVVLRTICLFYNLGVFISFWYRLVYSVGLFHITQLHYFDYSSFVLCTMQAFMPFDMLIISYVSSIPAHYFRSRFISVLRSFWHLHTSLGVEYNEAFGLFSISPNSFAHYLNATFTTSSCMYSKCVNTHWVSFFFHRYADGVFVIDMWFFLCSICIGWLFLNKFGVFRIFNSFGFNFGKYDYHVNSAQFMYMLRHNIPRPTGWLQKILVDLKISHLDHCGPRTMKVGVLQSSIVHGGINVCTAIHNSGKRLSKQEVANVCDAHNSFLQNPTIENFAAVLVQGYKHSPQVESAITSKCATLLKSVEANDEAYIALIASFLHVPGFSDVVHEHCTAAVRVKLHIAPPSNVTHTPSTLQSYIALLLAGSSKTDVFRKKTTLQSDSLSLAEAQSSYDSALSAYNHALAIQSSPDVLRNLKKTCNVTANVLAQSLKLDTKLRKLASSVAASQYKQQRNLTAANRIHAGIVSSIHQCLQKMDLERLMGVIEAAGGVVPMNQLADLISDKATVIVATPEQLKEFSLTIGTPSRFFFRGRTYDLDKIQVCDDNIFIDVDKLSDRALYPIALMGVLVKDTSTACDEFEKAVSQVQDAVDIQSSTELQANEVNFKQLEIVTGFVACASPGGAITFNVAKVIRSHVSGDHKLLAAITNCTNVVGISATSHGSSYVPVYKIALKPIIGGEICNTYLVTTVNPLERAGVCMTILNQTALQASYADPRLHALYTSLVFSFDAPATYLEQDVVIEVKRSLGDASNIATSARVKSPANHNLYHCYSGHSVCVNCFAQQVHSCDGVNYYMIPKTCSDPVKFYIQNRICEGCNNWLDHSSTLKCVCNPSLVSLQSSVNTVAVSPNAPAPLNWVTQTFKANVHVAVNSHLN
ncbi:MAG: ORF1a polyprotein [Pacific salmon nidovirus]|uniref:ORF1a polyprotein n=1 Tax=Pacific salmon nidovirus TaxID=2587487 RepID=A0AAE6IRP8_9NIDO|nr:MAG: ORF1a polyprotein [Pacific salmon nidovirus]QEG08236.1 MAG: ORF1a polyprotein [Pacific salmon nidovirus]